MDITKKMRAAVEQIWQSCLSHPFVRGLGDGTLPIEKFRHFLLQDYLYLYEYARVFAIGVVKARDPDLMRVFAANVDAILNEEMPIRRAYMERLGIAQEQVQNAKPALDNLSYTNYMVSVSANGGPSEIVAAILACSWSYAVIGQALAAIPGAKEHPLFGEWIRNFASEDYARTNEALIALMDTLASEAEQETAENLTQIFVNCSRFELACWDMAWEMRT